MKKILSLKDLYQFFVQQNKSVNFSFKDSGAQIAVHTIGYFQTEENNMPGMLKLKFKVCHTETNRNGSHISLENMEKAMPSLKYRPILAYIHELEDGTKDFYAHNMEIVEDENGESKINYIESQVGCFTSDDPWLEFDEDMGKTYVMAYGVIPEDYTEAANIIRRKNGTKVSCELVINELSYNAKEKYLELTDFYFNGTTLLGSDEKGNEIGEGMLGSRADIEDFYYHEPKFEYENKLIESLERLNSTLSSFNNIKFNEEGGDANMTKLEELLAKYEVKIEDLTFATEGLSDEELEVAFKNAFEVEGDSTDEENNSDEDNNDNDENSNDEDEGESSDDNSEAEDEAADNDDAGSDEGESFSVNPMVTKTYSVTNNGICISYEISHGEIRSALYGLISVYEEEDNEWYYITDVYNDYFIFEGWSEKIYKQSYKVDGDNVALSGDRQEVFKMILSESEKLAIEEMRKNYSALVDFKANTEALEVESKKQAIFNNKDFDAVRDSKPFKRLIENAAKYSLEECEEKAKEILDDLNSYASKISKKNSNVINIGKHVETTEGPYGNLFSK